MAEETQSDLNAEKKKPSLMAGPLSGMVAGTGIVGSTIPIQSWLQSRFLKNLEIYPEMDEERYRKVIKGIRNHLKIDPKIWETVIYNPLDAGYGRIINKPEEKFVLIPGKRWNPAVAAHEFGHAMGSRSIFHEPRLALAGLSTISSFGLPPVLGYRAAKGESLGSDLGKGTLTGGLTALTAYSPVLFEEGRATLRGLQALKSLGPKLISPAEIISGRKALIKAWLLHFSTLVGLGAATGAVSGGIGHSIKARRKWQEEQKKLPGGEKAASVLMRGVVYNRSWGIS